MANMNDEWESRISPNVVSTLTNPPPVNVPVQGDLLRSHNKRFDNPAEDVQVVEASETGGFMRKIFLGQYFMIIHDMDLNNRFGHAGSCRE